MRRHNFTGSYGFGNDIYRKQYQTFSGHYSGLFAILGDNAIQRFFLIFRKRPNGESGGPTTMLIGCRFLEKENGEPDEEGAAFS